jgi:hypothetical protein
MEAIRFTVSGRREMTYNISEFVVHVRVMDVYGKRVVYPVCDKAKVFASIADTKTLTETTLRCIQKLGYTIHVVPQEPLTLDL